MEREEEIIKIKGGKRERKGGEGGRNRGRKREKEQRGRRERKGGKGGRKKGEKGREENGGRRERKERRKEKGEREI